MLHMRFILEEFQKPLHHSMKYVIRVAMHDSTVDLAEEKVSSTARVYMQLLQVIMNCQMLFLIFDKLHSFYSCPFH